MLAELLEGCLSQNYRHTDAGGSWAAQREGDQLCLWFEHSNGKQDWLHNLYFAASPYREMDPPWECHSGFLRVWRSIKPLVEPMILDPSLQAVQIVGYSHGAALAVLCHEYVWYRRRDLRARMLGVGFGCPRVLFGCVPPEVALRWEQFYVVRNLDDLVTHLPPRALGFCHVGNLVELGEWGKYSAIDAHRPENYLRELERLAH